MNELLFFLTALLSFLGVVLFFRLWGKSGIFVWIAFSTVLMNIEVVKCITLFGLPASLGNVLYGSTFLCTDILSENYGGKISRKAVRLGFIVLIAFVILSQMSLLFIPNESDFASPALKTVLGFVPRMCLASVVAFLVSNTLDTYLYDFIARHTNKIWIRNNCSTMTSQLVDSIIFALVGWTGMFEWNVVLEMMLTTYIIKLIVAVIDTPFAYWGKRIYVKYHYNKTTQV